MEHKVTAFIRTKLFFQHRLKDLDNYEWVKVYAYELKNLGFRDHGAVLAFLESKGEIIRKADGTVRPVNPGGKIDPSLLEEAKKKTKLVAPLTALHMWMREQLLHVKLVGISKKDIPVYFAGFLKARPGDIRYFFKVDTFCGRVHTPVVSLKGDLRKHIRFYDEKVACLDVKQMQPTILGKVLSDFIGDNSFSRAIDNGEDVYVHIQQEANLPERKNAKEYFFQLVFGQPMDDIGKMFSGDTTWVNWINEYKRTPEPQNPHGRYKPHTNLAWLLQYSEVQVMSGIWQHLMDKDIPFLTIHDEVMCRESDKDEAYAIMNDELRKHFKYFEVTVSLNN